MEIRLAFEFEAAHSFDHVPADHIYRRLHGHSFRAEVALAGMPDPETGFIADFADIEQAVATLRESLDHRLLNEVEGLGPPSLENLALWIWQRLAPRFPNLTRIKLSRPSCGQSCVYYGPRDDAAVPPRPTGR